MKGIEGLAAFQEERAPATTALLSPAHLHHCLLPIFRYVCPVPVPYFHSPFSPHHLSSLTLSLDHLLRCFFQPIPLCWIPQPWAFHSRQLIYSLLPRLSWCSRRKAFRGTSHSEPAALRQICWTDSHGAQWLQPALRLSLSWTIFSAKKKKIFSSFNCYILASKQKSQKWWDPDFANSCDPKAMRHKCSMAKEE